MILDESGTDLGLVRVVGAPVVQVVTETGNQQTEHLQVVSEPVHLAGLEHGEHGLADVEGVAPVVVLDRAVVLLDTESPSADHLAQSTVSRGQSQGQRLTLYGIWNLLIRSKSRNILRTILRVLLSWYFVSLNL